MITDLRQIGIDRRYWYPAAREARFGRKPLAIRLWNQDIVLFRTHAGEIAALEDCCRHRKVTLSEGEVGPAGIACPFHGWCYDGSGRLASIPYWPKGKRLPQVGVKSFPTRVADGIVWVYAGDNAPSPEHEPFSRLNYEAGQWIHIVMDRVFDNHFAFGVVNGMDFFHFHLHRRYQPWQRIDLVRLLETPESVVADYEISVEKGLPASLFKRMLGRQGADKLVDKINVEYTYPHHFARVRDAIKIDVFFRPIDQNATHVFIDMRFPRPQGIWWFHWLYLKGLHRLFFLRIQAEDAWAGVLEQRGNERAPDRSRVEVNPVSRAVERVMESKWRDFESGSVEHSLVSGRRSPPTNSDSRLAVSVDDLEQ